MKTLKRWLSYRLWNLGHALYPYDTAPERDNTYTRVWEITTAFSATEDEADAIFDAVEDTICDNPNNDPFFRCRCVGASMRALPEEDE